MSDEQMAREWAEKKTSLMGITKLLTEAYLAGLAAGRKIQREEDATIALHMCSESYTKRGAAFGHEIAEAIRSQDGRE